MSLVALDELVIAVRISLDENAQQCAYMVGQYGENLELDEIIRLKLVEATRDITESASVELLEPVPMETEVKATDWGGTLTVPDDFLRIAVLKMAGWNKSVTTLVKEDSDISLMQRNRFTRGSTMKPVCVLSFGADGKKVIEYFGVSDQVEKALYIPIPSTTVKECTEYIEMSSLLKESIVRRTAGLVLQARGETDLAKVYLG